MQTEIQLLKLLKPVNSISRYNRQMETKTLSQKALDVIEQYSNFSIGSTHTNVPYFNNKTTKKRLSLRAYIGKGSPGDIQEELESIIIKDKIDQNSLDGKNLKKILIDNDLGIECSGYVYHILEAESISRNLGTISKNINFIKKPSFLGQIICSIRPVENCDTETFAHDTNSNKIDTKDVLPGDIITMIGDKTNKERNHILIVKEVNYVNNSPKQIIYSHSVAYPEDGLYNTGPRQGSIEILDTNLPITEQKWIEENHQGEDNKLYVRAKNSQTEIRRLKFF